MIDDKVLDELVESLRKSRAVWEDGKHRPEDRETEAADAIAALRAERDEARARVRELEEERDGIQHALRQVTLDLPRQQAAYRQVTREQLRIAADAAGWEDDLDIAANIIAEKLNLEIVEGAPKAEARECDCETFHSMDGLGYLCKRLPTVNGFKCVQYRCTSTEGERDG